MADYDMTPVRPGADNGGTDKRALFLKVSAGEVMTAFKRRNVMLPLSQVRTISQGKEASFNATGRVQARYHDPGTLITGQQANVGERIIRIDKLLIADVTLPEIEEAMAHYDVRGPLTTEMGEALARQVDARLIQVAINAARANGTVEEVSPGDGTGTPGGTQLLKGADVETDASVFEKALRDAALALDENHIPEEDRHAVIRPAQYHLLLEVDKLVSTEYSDGNGNVSRLMVNRAADATIHKSTNIPNSNITNSVNSAYDGDFSNTVAWFGRRDAVGTVKLMDMRMAVKWQEEYQTHLMLAKQAMGHGILRPEVSVEISKGT